MRSSRSATATRALGHLLLLGPRAIAHMVAVPRGRAATVVARQRAVVGADIGAAKTPVGAWHALAHAVLSLVLWLPVLVLLGLFVLALLRGLFYGLVVNGPYTDAWGGPTRGGAWLVHALVSLPILAAAGLGFVGLNSLHTRVTRQLLGGGASGWVIPVAFLAGAVGTLLIIAWSRPI